MINILIVDDQPNVVEGIVCGVDWYRLRVDNICKAYEIESAKVIIEEKAIDILICDIEMPMGTGIDLLRWVREKEKRIECIFLTAHPEFEYAQQAISLSSFEYLLQPIRYEDLERVIKNAIEKVKHNLQDSIYNERGKYWEKGKDLLEEKVWHDIIISGILENKTSAQKIQEDLQKQFDLSINTEIHYIIVLISIENKKGSREKWSGYYLNYALQNVFQELMNYRDVKMVSNTVGQWFVVIPQYEEIMEEDISQRCQVLIGTCKRYCHCNLACYVANSSSIEQIYNNVQHLLAMDNNNVAAYSGVYTMMEEQQKTKDYMNEVWQKIEIWKKMLSDHKEQQIISEVKQYMDQCRHRKLIDRNFLRDFQQGFISMCDKAMTAENGYRLSGIKGEKIYAQMTESTESIENMNSFVENLLESVSGKSEKINESGIIGQAKEYIIDNLSSELSCEEIASQLFISPGHLSRQFKKYTGLTLGEYITGERVNLAKKLLISTNLPISIIVSECGYTNFSYFSQVFKKVTGLSPNSYRKQPRKS